MAAVDSRSTRSLDCTASTVTKTCPKCAGEMRYLPPPKVSGFLAYFGSDVVFWVVVVLGGGAASCAVDGKFALASVLGGVAMFFSFILIYRAGENVKLGEGVHYCAKCQYYLKPEHAKGGTGAI